MRFEKIVAGQCVELNNGGVAALELAKAYRPDAVFLDIGMPEMDGNEVARRLRQQPGFANVMLAALTGWGQQEDRRAVKRQSLGAISAAAGASAPGQTAGAEKCMLDLWIFPGRPFGRSLWRECSAHFRHRGASARVG
jgi:CheY-like chemotaxis protein